MHTLDENKRSASTGERLIEQRLNECADRRTQWAGIDCCHFQGWSDDAGRSTGSEGWVVLVAGDSYLVVARQST